MLCIAAHFRFFLTATAIPSCVFFPSHERILTMEHGVFAVKIEEKDHEKDTERQTRIPAFH